MKGWKKKTNKQQPGRTMLCEQTALGFSAHSLPAPEPFPGEKNRFVRKKPSLHLKNPVCTSKTQFGSQKPSLYVKNPVWVSKIPFAPQKSILDLKNPVWISKIQFAPQKPSLHLRDVTPRGSGAQDVPIISFKPHQPLPVLPRPSLCLLPSPGSLQDLLPAPGGF